MKPIWMFILPAIFLDKSPFTPDRTTSAHLVAYTIAQAVPSYLRNSDGLKSSAFDTEVMIFLLSGLGGTSGHLLSLLSCPLQHCSVSEFQITDWPERQTPSCFFSGEDGTINHVFSIMCSFCAHFPITP